MSLNPQLLAAPKSDEGRSTLNSLKGLRICFLAGTLGPGGAERQLYYAVQVLRQAGAKVHVLALTRGDHWEEPVLRQNIPVTWVGESPSRWRRLFRIMLELRRAGAEVIQCQHFYTNVYGAIAARMLGIREVGAVRSNVFGELTATGKVAGALNLRLPRLLAANSRAAIATLSKLGIPPARTFCLPNAIDTEKFSPRPERAAEKSGPIRLLTVGRLSEEKRFDRFLDLVAQVRGKSHLPVKGIIVGSGRPDRDLRPFLEARARQLGLLPGHLEFRGAVSDMEAVYAEADIFALTSDREGTPNVILEAMASGLPVVATNVGGVPEIVQHGRTGFVVQVGELDTMTGHVLNLVADRDMRLSLGGRARTYIESAHSLARLPACLAELYAQVLPRLRNTRPAAPEFSTAPCN